MKKKLMIQSLSPLALLTIVNNFSFITTYTEGHKLSICDLWSNNKILIVVMTVCIIWLLYAVWCYIEFAAFKFTDKESGFTINVISEDNEASLNFFMTLIIPLLIDKVETLQGALTLLIIIIMMCVLLSKTSLLFANPVLAMLGYHICIFNFQQNTKYTDDRYYGICKTVVKDKHSIEFKPITEKVFYIREL